jgi:hypothetical protein
MSQKCQERTCGHFLSWGEDGKQTLPRGRRQEENDSLEPVKFVAAWVILRRYPSGF